MSGFKQAAAHAILDYDHKLAIKAYCKLEGLSFKHVWKLEKIKRFEKLVAIRNGKWKSPLSAVNFCDDPPIAPKKKSSSTTRSFQSGRFTVTVTVG